MISQALGAMKPGGGSSPSRARARIFEPEIKRKSSCREES